MANRGRNLYVPQNVLKELDNIMINGNAVKGKKKNRKFVDAWDKMVFYTKVGRNVDDVYSVIFGKVKR